jgi:mono/diheme cytochrome c family protein
MKKSLVPLAQLTLLGGATGYAQTKKAAVANLPASTTAPVTRGKEIYASICIACHQADGSGVPRLNPPLAANECVAGPT